MTYMYDPQLDDIEYFLRAQEDESKVSILGGPALPALGHAISGATGAAISNVITYPLALSITRLQVQRQFKGSSSSSGKDAATTDDEEYKSIADAFQRIYAEEGGIAAFYSGCTQDTLKSMADSFLFFLAYNFIRKDRMQKHGGAKKLPVYEELLVGMAAGAFSKFFTTPIQQIVTRKQTAAMIAKRSPNASASSKKLSTRDIAMQIKQQKGLAGFWAGYSASLVLTINPSLTMMFHGALLRLLVKRDRRSNPGAKTTFLIAALSKAMVSTITYPFSLAKARAQVSSKKPLKDDEHISTKEDSAKQVEEKAARKLRKDTIFDTVLQIARDEGLEGLYQGLGGEVMKGFFAHGLTMLMKERIHTIVIQLYYWVLKAIQKYPSPQELKGLASKTANDVKGAVVETASDVKEAVGDAANTAVDNGKAISKRGQEALQNTIESFGEIYRKGREDAADFLDDYLPFDDNDW
ncbi:uncharacterized protein PV09_04342 [Verruconis gallopava]|uniref:Mitochondrial thiamine pyrophosphate carrier 1 n=1 Tax=Verruconis gallopava TaxID=253628 RepID=A0A0D2AZS5_9PEZI|nr:uncharacterized protein PV09_04342 [Verruconis gallopava]KIW04594.1 hypothetical protein PV09_04342 [Verruconis gallopava]